MLLVEHHLRRRELDGQRAYPSHRARCWSLKPDRAMRVMDFGDRMTCTLLRNC